MSTILRPFSFKMLLITLVAYIATATCSTIAFGTTTPVWYSNAILLAPLLLRTPRLWPLYLLPGWAINATIIETFGDGNGPLLALADLVEIVLAAALVRATGGIRSPIVSAVQFARVTTICVCAPLASATFAGLVLQRMPGAEFGAIWHEWYLGGMLGLVIGTLFILSWSDPALRPRSYRPVSIARHGPLLAGTLLCAFLVQNQVHEVLLFLTFPLVFAITWRYGLLGATFAMASVTVAVLWVMARGHGAIAALLEPASMAARMEAAQVYLASILLSTLPLTVLRARQRQLTENLRAASDARTEFLAAMSHEIRTPMTGVLGLVDLLGSETLTERQQGYVDALRLSGAHLLSIINDILDFSRIESGKLELEEVSFRVSDLLERVGAFTRPQAVERGLAIRTDVVGEADAVYVGDELRLRQVLLNLVSNAIKFTERGEVVLRVLPRADAQPGRRWLRFEIHDTGVGIPPDKLDLLFSPFTQADQSIARQYGGSGLGLAISKRLVEAMGGTISARSTVGEGSTFAFEVPLRAGEQVHQAPDAQPVRARPLRILIAEDVAINREILRTALTRDGHRLLFANDGAQAVELAASEPVELVLMDVQMPVMDGVEATRRIRNLGGRFTTLPIIGLTANVMARERERYMAAGMDQCLAKPIDWQLLGATLARYGGRAAPAPADQAVQADQDKQAGEAGQAARAAQPARADESEHAIQARQVDQADEAERAAGAEAAAAVEAQAQAQPQPQPQLQPRTGPDAPALIDERALDGLRQIATPDELVHLVGLGLGSCDKAIATLQAPDADAGSIVFSAHKLKGSAGQVGLAALSRLGAEIEAAGGAGDASRAAIARLGEVMAATRAELQRRGLLR